MPLVERATWIKRPADVCGSGEAIPLVVLVAALAVEPAEPAFA